ncbi:bifunctional (p)ppGpp synthetase/guanosine-3',5'-bis(diphosphate) 3'-pyrophosphohydrolase [Polynucleobacter sp. 30F-ANTBAC]|uniref:RelA/SpoT family protein n=1 Tax=Polynucleobacter sp. 30F-ANTBAC TaxID=2689095 RepID=UPI001C0DF6CE|nr:bifunctional (p)ppGpp synthetase/guanosine-3',5'-bis(diphosphate) 3'-pyrophosphohydrolase [Polynucleobacter sp. 30F-ANTBAC]
MATNPDAQGILAAILEQSSRHLFGPTSQPAKPPKPQVISLAGLTEKITHLKPEEIALVRKAFQYADSAHLGQYRQSGEPYITHPLAVAELCASWRLDASSIMAALLHDVIEDTGSTREELVEVFGSKVAELVEGLTKLDKLEFQSHAEAQAESFRKMFMAMARDVRVILVKLADRLHNMRTLDAMALAKRKRVALETSEIYAPIAHRLGLNQVYRELQDLSFMNWAPFRYATLNNAIKKARGNRKEMVAKILDAARMALSKSGLESDLRGREKTLYSIYMKMRQKHLSFSQVLDVYAFRVTLNTVDECYRALGVLHALYKPMPGKFKDYIAIPKLNGYQSLHTTLVGPFGMPVEFQIRTQDMHEVAEEGVAAHWAYKEGDDDLTEMQTRAHQWLQSLIDIQNKSGDSQEFLEHVKIDLFPDAVYVFTPKGQIRALPRGATVLDFAYAVHSDLGNECVGAKVNGVQLPLRTELKNGDIVEITSVPNSQPNPVWLTFVKTGKARAAIRHFLKTRRYSEAIQLGERLLSQALRQQGSDAALVTDEVWEKLLHWTGSKGREELCADMAMGHRVPAVIAKRIEMIVYENKGHSSQMRLDTPDWDPADESTIHHRQAIMIDGAGGQSVTFPACCHAIPGDTILGYLGKGEGLQIHTDVCRQALRLQHRDPEHWIDVVWSDDIKRSFDVAIRVDVKNGKGVLAKIAGTLTSADANIAHVAMEDRFTEVGAVSIHFVIQVDSRYHLAKVMRRLRQNADILRITRVFGK